jgi:hypothetical protein
MASGEQFKRVGTEENSILASLDNSRFCLYGVYYCPFFMSRLCWKNRLSQKHAGVGFAHVCNFLGRARTDNGASLFSSFRA